MVENQGKATRESSPEKTEPVAPEVVILVLT